MITIKFFAGLKTIADKDSIEIFAEENMNLENIFSIIENKFYKIGKLLKEKKVLVALNQEMITSPDTPVKDGDEIAIMPPFSGGKDQNLNNQ